MQADPGLDVDQRDVVREHVVQLARDAQALLARPTARFLLLNKGTLGGALLIRPRYLGADERLTSSHAAHRECSMTLGGWSYLAMRYAICTP